MTSLAEATQSLLDLEPELAASHDLFAMEPLLERRRILIERIQAELLAAPEAARELHPVLTSVLQGTEQMHIRIQDERRRLCMESSRLAAAKELIGIESPEAPALDVKL